MQQNIARHDGRPATANVSSNLALMAIVVGLIIAWVCFCGV